MQSDEAQAQAQRWWGPRGKALLVASTDFGYAYKVGLTTLNANLGGFLSTTLAASRVSFEDAFVKAAILGHGPVVEGEDEDE